MIQRMWRQNIDTVQASIQPILAALVGDIMADHVYAIIRMDGGVTKYVGPLRRYHRVLCCGDCHATELAVRGGFYMVREISNPSRRVATSCTCSGMAPTSTISALPHISRGGAMLCVHQIAAELSDVHRRSVVRPYTRQ